MAELLFFFLDRDPLYNTGADTPSFEYMDILKLKACEDRVEGSERNLKLSVRRLILCHISCGTLILIFLGFRRKQLREMICRFHLNFEAAIL